MNLLVRIDMRLLRNYVIHLVLVLILLHSVYAFQPNVLNSAIKPGCPDQTCGPDRPIHSFCLHRKPDKVRTATCRRYKHYHRLNIRDEQIRNIVDGHNGLRNRVALDYWHPVADMRMLRWDKNLQRMAEGWIGQCRLHKQDECDYICKQ